MNKKDKQKILFILAFIAFSLSIASNFTKMYSIQLSDFNKDPDYDPETFDWKYDYYFFVNSFISFDARDKEFGGEINVKSSLTFLHIYHFSTSGERGYRVYSPMADETVPAVVQALILCISLVFTIFMGLTYYFGAIAIKEFNKTNSKKLLYAGLMLLFIQFVFYMQLRFNWSVFDTANQGRADYIRIEPGFYYVLASAVIFLVVYIIQLKVYHSENDNEEKNMEKLDV